jgi:integrase
MDFTALYGTPQKCHGKRLILWWARQDLNLGPMDYESTALTAELRALKDLRGYHRTLYSISTQCHAAPMKKRAAYGSGSIFEASGGFYIRYRTNALVNGQPQRVQKTARLCDKDPDKYYAKDAKAVRLLRKQFLSTIEDAPQTNGSSPKDMKIADYWDQVYLPFLESSVSSGSKSPTTRADYKKYWDCYLKNHFNGRTFLGYSTGQGTNFLTGLASRKEKPLSAATLHHIRAVGSSIFKHAIKTDALGANVLTVNPWRNVGSLTKGKRSQTEHYTLQEIQNVIHALGHCTVEHKQKEPVPHAAEVHEHLDAQLLMALTFFCGLRPSEAIGLDWSDIKDGHIYIQRAVVNGIAGNTKTDEAAAPIKLIEPVLSLLMAWHKQCGSPSVGWIFNGKESGKPINIPNIVARVIRPCLKEAGLAWKGLYAGRRGVATMLVDLTNGLVAAKELLRHKNMTTTAKFYQKQTQGALESGMKLLEAAAANGNGKEAEGQR